MIEKLVLGVGLEPETSQSSAQHTNPCTIKTGYLLDIIFLKLV